MRMRSSLMLAAAMAAVQSGVATAMPETETSDIKRNEPYRLARVMGFRGRSRRQGNGGADDVPNN